MLILSRILLCAAPLFADGTPTPPPAAPTGVLAACRPVRQEPRTNRENRDSNDGFRAELISKGEQYFLPAGPGGMLIVAQKGYLDAPALARLCADLKEARDSIPAALGVRSLVGDRFTVYVYDDNGPASEADVPGVRLGEKGVMLKYVKEDEAPTFHELTHLLVGVPDSISLSEGLADWTQDRFRPGKAYAFTPANADPDVLTRYAARNFQPAFLDSLGEPGGRSFKDEIGRHFYYFASWSFVKYLIARKDMASFLAVFRASGSDAAYRLTYGTTAAALRAAWLRAIGAR